MGGTELENLSRKSCFRPTLVQLADLPETFVFGPPAETPQGLADSVDDFLLDIERV